MEFYFDFVLIFLAVERRICLIISSHETLNWMVAKHVSFFLNNKLNEIIKKILIDFVINTGKIRDFLIWIKDNLLRERPELFIQDDSV